jgi:hypothetical protein
MERLLRLGKFREAWKLLQKVTGTNLGDIASKQWNPGKAHL